MGRVGIKALVWTCKVLDDYWRNPRRDFELAVEYMSLDFRTEVWARDGQAGSLCYVHKYITDVPG